MKKVIVIISIILIAGTAYYFFAASNSSQSNKLNAQALPSVLPGQSFTLAEVATHNSESSCYAAIDNEVYDLTGWISKHPGGPSKILNICGTDATQAFHNQHEGQRRPNQELANFKIGTLSAL